MFKWTADGSTVAFATREKLVGEDTDNATDIYTWSGGTTTLVSQGPNGFNGEFDAVPTASSDDLSAILFTTAEQMVNADTDSSIDLYRRQGARRRRSREEGRRPGSFNGPIDVDPFAVTASDGSRTMFSTDEELNPTEEDGAAKDVYTRLEETTSVVSSWTIFIGYQEFLPSYLEAANPDINLTVFSTVEQLEEIDKDNYSDVYWRYGGSTELLSRGPKGASQGSFNGPNPAFFQRYQPGTNGVFFTTAGKTGPPGH